MIRSSLKKFNGKEFQFGGSAFKKKEALKIQKRFLRTKLVRVRITKDKHGYLIWLRPTWMDKKNPPPESIEFRFRFMSPEFNDFIRSGF